MPCIITRNQEGKITSVLDENTNAPSQLFNKIVEHPHVKDNEEAYNIMLNTFTEEFPDSSQIVYKSGTNNVFNTFAEALKDSDVGNVEMGINSEGEFNSLFKVSGQQDVSTPDGFINNYIRKNIISDKKVKQPDGSFRLRGWGAQDLTAITSSIILETESSHHLGRDRIVTYPDGTFELLEEEPLILSLKNGTTKEFNKDEIKQQLKEGKYDELNKQIDGFPSVVYNIFRQENELFGKEQTPTYSSEEESALRNHLLNILSSMGISVTSITNYVKNYKIRNGIDLSVDAIADVANGVVAFADGKVSLENLAEETAHIIIEAHNNQDEINSFLSELEGTDEWNEYNEIYYEKYKELYSGEKLENAVRREILGKILYKNIITNFAPTTNVKNENVVGKLMNLLNNFIQTIQSYFIPSTRTKLDGYIKQATQIALSKNASEHLDVDTLYRSNVALYSVNNAQTLKETERVSKQLLVKLEEIKQTLERRLLTLQKVKDPGVQKLKTEIRKLAESIESNNTIYAIQAIVFSNDSQIKELKTALDRYKKKSVSADNKTPFFNEKDQATYNYLKNTSLPQLSALLGILRNMDKNDAKRNSLLSQVESQIKDLAIIEGDKFLQSGRDFDAIFERNVFEYGMSKEDKEKLRAMYETEQKDISAFQQWFGQLEHSSNPILGLLGKIINGNYHKARLKTLEIINPVLAKANKEGWNMAKMSSIIEKDKNGKLTGWLISDTKWAEFTADEKKMREDALLSVLTDEQKTSKILPTESELTDTQFEDYTRIKEEWYAENTERIFTNEYYQQKEQRYIDAGVGRDLREILKHFSQRRATILDTYRKGGQIDYANIAPEDLDGLKRIALDRKAIKSSYDALTGELKDGNELEIVEQLQRLDALTFDKSNVKVVKDSFYDTLKKVEAEQGNQAAYEWLRANGGIVFSDQFWDGLKNQNSSLTERMRETAERIEDEYDSERLFTKADELEELLNSKNQILKQYATPNAPSEIDVEVMPEGVKTIILTKENDIQQILQDVNTLMDKYGEETITVSTSETTVNEAYYKALSDSDILDENKFIQQHLTDYNKKRVNAFATRLEKITNNSSRDYVEPSFLRWLGVSDISEVRTLIAEKGIDQLVVDYGKSKIAGYFKRFAPAGYDNILLSLENGASVVQLVDNINNGVLPNLSISTRFEWVEDELSEEFLNPNYDKNAKAGIRQPKLGKYRNQSYAPTADQLDMLNTFRGMMSTALTNFGEEESRNENKLPMIGAQTYEKIQRASIAQGKDWIKDIIYNRADEMAYGARIDNQDVMDIGDMKIIPKQYLNDLEDVQTVSKDLLYSYSALVHASNLYVERQNMVEDVHVLQDKLLSRPFEKGKTADSTKTLKMFNGFVDNYMYGIKLSHKKVITIRGKEIDISRWIQIFDRFIRKMGTGFSPVIAATSALVSNLQFGIETAVGQYTNKSSSTWALKEMAKLMPEYSLDMGRTERKSKMYILGETFGIHDYNNKTQSAGYNRILRTFSQLPYSFMTVMSAPHLNTTMLSVLDDFRIVDGTFVTRNEYKGTEAQWKALRQQSLYNSLTIENGRAVMKPEVETVLGKELSDAIIQRAALKIDRVNGYIDSTISDTDRTNASRHYLWNLTLGFRGYLTLLVQRKTKKNHFNFVHGTMEEGHYMGAFKFVKNLFSLNKEENVRNFVGSVRKNWGSLSVNEQQNLKRTMIEFGVFAAMTALAISVANYSDDDKNKNKWGVQLMAFLYFRTANELGSSIAPFSILNGLDVVKQPIVIMNNLDKLTTMSNLNPQKIIESGAYKGHSKLTRTILQQTYIKNWFQLSDIKGVSDFYRLNNSEVLISSQKKSKDEDVDNEIQDNTTYSDLIRRN